MGDGTRADSMLPPKDNAPDRAVQLLTSLLVSHSSSEKLLDAIRFIQCDAERLRGLPDAIPHLIWANATDGSLEYVNARWRAYTGMTLEQGEGWGWAQLVHPDDWPERLALWGKARHSREPFEQSYRLRRSDGLYRWHIARVVPVLDSAGQLVRWYGTATDVHDMKELEAELRHSENRFRTLADGVPQLVWRSADFGAWKSAGSRWCAYTGLSAEASVSLGWLSAVHPADRSEVMNAWSAAASSGELTIEHRIWNSQANEYRWFQTRAAPVRDSNGLILEWLGASTDIDQIRRYQNRQQVLVEELQHRSRNVIAIVQSMAAKMIDSAGSLDAFHAALGERLSALSRVQSLLSRTQEDTTVQEIVELELAAHGVVAGSPRAKWDGPRVVLRPRAVQSLSLALHELATNALKYGALIAPSGRLTINWRMESLKGEKLGVRLTWIEEGVLLQQQARDERRGYGRDLIEKSLVYDLGASTTFEFGPDGVQCVILLPVADL